MTPEIQPRPAIRTGEDHTVLTEEMLQMLSTVERTHSLTAAARELKLSYRHLWTLVRRMEKQVGKKLVVATRGGKGGGGSVNLTEEAISILRSYRKVADGLKRVAGEEGFWENLGIKMSVRNRLRGRVLSVELDAASAKVVVHVNGPADITSLITREAAEELELKVGDPVEALVKSTEVMLLKRTGRARTS